MAYYARISENKMQVLIEGQQQMRHQHEMLIGEQLLDFVYFDLSKLNDALDHAYSLAYYMKDPNFERTLKKLDMQNIYLRFFVELFLDAVHYDKPATKAGFETLRSQYPQEIAFLEQNSEKFKNVTYRTISKPFLIGIFSVHAMGMQSFMKQQLEFCVDGANDEKYQQLSPIERLYIYEQWRKSKGEQPLYFETDTFSSRLVIGEEISTDGEFSIEGLADKLKKQKPQIAEMTVLPNGWALMRFELMKMVSLGVPIRKCANCCRYFILDGRSDITYCSRPLANQPGKTCQDVGALNKYMDKVHADPIRKEFHKAYKRNHSRVRVGTMTQIEFLEWSDEAREKRDQCIAGVIDKDEFMEWLNSDRRYRKRD
jgi:hypothetical protein